MIHQKDIIDFLNRQEDSVLVDVRSEGEYAQGHIPGAISFPLLNDEERKEVGTCYKQQGNVVAVLLGYELVGPKFKAYLERAVEEFSGQDVYLHCWRGGLRSRIMANLFDTVGLKVHVLKGGYKIFRRLVLEKLDNELPINVLGGFTGSGKTKVLRTMKELGFQVLDLEALANHRGSAFGGIGLGSQPTQEQFENNLFMALQKLDCTQTIWVEDESRQIGKCVLPEQLFQSIRKEKVYFLNYSFDDRVKEIMRIYGTCSVEDLRSSTFKIAKRLGNLRLKTALELLEHKQIEEWSKLILAYYDKSYLKGLSMRVNPENKVMVELKGEELFTFLKEVQ